MVFSEPQIKFPEGANVCARAMTESAALGEFAVSGSVCVHSLHTAHVSAEFFVKLNLFLIAFCVKKNIRITVVTKTIKQVITAVRIFMSSSLNKKPIANIIKPWTIKSLPEYRCEKSQ